MGFGARHSVADMAGWTGRLDRIMHPTNYRGWDNQPEESPRLKSKNQLDLGFACINHGFREFSKFKPDSNDSYSILTVFKKQIERLN